MLSGLNITIPQNTTKSLILKANISSLAVSSSVKFGLAPTYAVANSTGSKIYVAYEKVLGNTMTIVPSSTGSSGSGSNTTGSSGSGVNVAAAANGGSVFTSSVYNSNFPASAIIDGDRIGKNWAIGGGWNDSTPNSYPDWVEISFNGSKNISQINIFTLQDNYAAGGAINQSTSFTQYGITDFSAQYFNGSSWQDIPNAWVGANNLVWRQFTFSPILATKIRINITKSLYEYSRVVEVEAY